MNVVECKTLYYILLLLQLLLFCVEPFGGEWEDICFGDLCNVPACYLCYVHRIFTFSLFVYSSYISFDENLLGLDNKLQPYTFQTHAGECPSIFGHTYAANCVCMCVIPNVSGT